MTIQKVVRVNMQDATIQEKWDLFAAQIIALGIVENNYILNETLEASQKQHKTSITSDEVGILFYAFLTAKDATQASHNIATAHREFCPQFQLKYATA
jgi:hypothetical protein